MKKTVSVLDVLKVNTMFKEKEIKYYLRINGSCGCQGLVLLSQGDEYPADYLCNLINEVLKDKFLKVKPGTINPYNLILF